MAQLVRTEMTCDSGNRTAHKRDEHPADETIRFSLNGVNWEIDLCAAEAKRFLKQMSQWMEWSRKPAATSAQHGRRRTAMRPAGGKRTKAARDHTAAIRAWAKDQGITVSERGRIPGEVVQQYERATA